MQMVLKSLKIMDVKILGKGFSKCLKIDNYFIKELHMLCILHHVLGNLSGVLQTDNNYEPSLAVLQRLH